MDLILPQLTQGKIMVGLRNYLNLFHKIEPDFTHPPEGFFGQISSTKSIMY